MENKKNLICFLGLANTGKGYNSQLYIEKGFKKISLADPLRDMLWDILGFKPNNILNYDKFKKSKLIVNISNILFKKTVEITTGRKLLQNLGSVMKNTFGEKFWVKKWYENVINSNCDIVVDDMRFPYEVKMAQNLIKNGYNVTFVWVCYEKANFKELLKDTHESEALAQFMYKNRDKYGLYDLCVINEFNMNKILKDFKKQMKS